MKSPKLLLTQFLSATEGEVLKLFSRLHDKPVIPENFRYVYLPGTRKDRLLLVAHADTVPELPPQLQWVGDVCMSLASPFFGAEVKYNTPKHGTEEWRQWNRPNGALGADDRAGCAMLYGLYDPGHSVLITTGEEKGCIGAQQAAKELKDELANHSFAVEIDRKGTQHAVFYDVATNKFKEHIMKMLRGCDPHEEEWTERPGSSTDIARICDEVGICGVNLSAGYFNEHSSEEILVLDAWLRTMKTLAKIVKVKEHEQFKLPRKTYKYRGSDHSSFTDTPRTSEHAAGKPTKAAQQESHNLGGGETFSIPFSVGKKKAKKLFKRLDHLLRKKKISVEAATFLADRVAMVRDKKLVLPETDIQIEKTTSVDLSTQMTSDLGTRSSGVQCPATIGPRKCKLNEFHEGAHQYGEHTMRHETCPMVSLDGSLKCIGLHGHPGAHVFISAKRGEGAVIMGTSPQPTRMRALPRPPVSEGPREIVKCFHECPHPQCREGHTMNRRARWWHRKPHSGVCVMAQTTNCPIHSAITVEHVAGYEQKIGHSTEGVAHWGMVPSETVH